MQIIDTHLHFWDLANNINSWVVNGNIESLKRNYTINDYCNTYESSVKGITIESVDGAYSLAEVKWIYKQVKNKMPYIKHIAYIDMTQESMQFEIKLREFKQYNFVIGFRDIMSFSQNSSYSPCINDITLDKLKLINFKHNLETLAKNNYIFNCQMYPHQLLRVNNIIANSNVRCIIDHCGLPEFTNLRTKNEWLDMLNEYSKFAKFKISGIDINNNQENIIEICQILLQTAQIDNLFIGSNFPVSDFMIFKQLYETLGKLLSKGDLDRLLINNAEAYFFATTRPYF